MKKIETFQKQITEKIQLKCRPYHLNPKLIKFRMVDNMTIIEVPSHHTYIGYIYFKGVHENHLNELLNIDRYLTDAVDSMFTTKIRISESDNEKYLEEYDGAYEDLNEY